ADRDGVPHPQAGRGERRYRTFDDALGPLAQARVEGTELRRRHAGHTLDHMEHGHAFNGQRLDDPEAAGAALAQIDGDEDVCEHGISTPARAPATRPCITTRIVPGVSGYADETALSGGAGQRGVLTAVARGVRPSLPRIRGRVPGAEGSRSR